MESLQRDHRLLLTRQIIEAEVFRQDLQWFRTTAQRILSIPFSLQSERFVDAGVQFEDHFSPVKYIILRHQVLRD